MSREQIQRKIVIVVGQQEFSAVLNDTQTAQRVYEALPIEAEVNRWGDEIYFRTEVRASKSDPTQQDMDVGDLAFWPPGNAFCIFWDRRRPRPATHRERLVRWCSSAG